MADPNPGNPFPQAIARAVIEVMSALGTLAKGHENTQQGRYKYASIDDFIGAVRGHCIAAKLFIIPNEADGARLVDVQAKGGPAAMWLTRFAFTLVHESGESYGPIYKTVMVYATGAQSAGAAQSYALKQLMRGLFQIQTGEEDDPDNDKRDIRSTGDTETDLQRKAGRIRKEMLAADDMDELSRAWSDNAMTIDLIRTASETAFNFLKAEYDRKKDMIENAPIESPRGKPHPFEGG